LTSAIALRRSSALAAIGWVTKIFGRISAST
jgi:hypothetical protein